MLVASILLYPGRGELERSAMYVLPFAILPAAEMLERLLDRSRSAMPLVVSLAFLAVQCSLIELCLYTYW